jgi:hypothetical protein
VPPAAYSMPTEAVQRLDALVDRIEARPGDLIRPREFEELQPRLAVRRVLGALPDGLSEDDFAGILKLALLTECATESYAAAIDERARAHDAAWLRRFIANVWTPDELTHHAPYKLMLRDLGFEEAELDREVRETQERRFVHAGGYTPVQVTTFGMVQEYLTDNWHGLIANLMKRASPEAAWMASRIKRRETLHTVWYRDMTALQLEAAPRLLPQVAQELANFRMPGNSLVPELQSQSERWLHLLGARLDRVFRDLLRLVHETVNDARLTGRIIVELAVEKGMSLGPVKTAHIRAAIDRLGGPGYGLIGEAVLESAGLEYLFRPNGGAQDRAYAPYQGLAERLRALLRTWLARRISLEVGVV